MKKTNIVIIATLIIALHALILYAILGSKNKEEESAPSNPYSAYLPKEHSDEPPDEGDGTLVDPHWNTRELPEIDELPPAPTPLLENIAVPQNRSGYLRSDRPDNRTSRVYSELIGDPYQSAIVVDAHTGRILYENKATNYAYPASVTKMMTLLIVLEQIDAGKISLNDKVAITKEGISMRNSSPSQVYLDTRESGEFTVHNLLQAMMIHSACDASQVLAIHVAGSREAFVKMMNLRARELGMNSTIFHSEHGLPPVDGSQPDISTAYDIALLSLAIMRHPETLEYTSTKLAYLPTNAIRDKAFMLANRNVLVGKDPYPGCDGLKTGYHAKGGYSLAATAKKGDQRVLAVILGVPDSTTRTAEARKLLDTGFERIAP
ncbi:MAG: D-alanyl-D-alanine carboxypeptidase [Pontiellaceae bacterium]|nr:D-alanyl-D-alanine carboxypeptidase [Pontiellaceae bacterium]